MPGLVVLRKKRLDDGKQEFDKRWGFETLKSIQENARQHQDEHLLHPPQACSKQILKKLYSIIQYVVNVHINGLKSCSITVALQHRFLIFLSLFSTILGMHVLNLFFYREICMLLKKKITI